MKSQFLSVDNLATDSKNAQKEAVKTVCLSFGNSLYHLENALIIPQRNHSDLVLFAGKKVTPNKPAKSFFFFGKKNPPLHKTITAAVISTISQLIDKVDLKTLDEIKTALSEVNEHFENGDNDPNSFGFDLSGGAL